MTAEATTIPFDGDVALTYAFYGAILGAKMLVVALLTSRQRFKKKVFLNPEDSKLYGGESEKDSDVERVRRAHLNDMENIYLFFFLSAFYLMTGPNPLIAVNLVRVFAVSRIFHTVCYLCELPQPSRTIAFLPGIVISFYMIGVVVVYLIYYV